MRLFVLSSSSAIIQIYVYQFLYLCFILVYFIHYRMLNDSNLLFAMLFVLTSSTIIRYTLLLCKQIYLEIIIFFFNFYPGHSFFYYVYYGCYKTIISKLVMILFILPDIFNFSLRLDH
jgi:hypothetical protein